MPSFGLTSLPLNPLERALMLQNGLIANATDGAMDAEDYFALRADFMSDPRTAPLLPQFVRICRDLSSFWSFIKAEASQYEPRRRLIRAAFEPLLEYLETGASAADRDIGDVLSKFDPDSVHGAWTKALKRVADDPDGAITASRTLVETVCKHILDDLAAATPAYGPADDLPKLYGAVSKALNLAPSQHSEEVFRRILGGCSSVVEGLGSLRNKLGDAHGQGRRAVRVSTRHARLAVNLAGAMATFLVESHVERHPPAR